MSENDRDNQHQSASELRFVIESLETLAERKRSPIQRVIDLGRRLVAKVMPTCSSRQLSKQNDSEQNRLIDAIAVIKTHYLKYEDGGEKGGKRAATRTASLNHHSQESHRILSLRTAPWHVSKPAEESATPHELDLFRVKAISLIRSNTMRTASLKEALEAIRQTPILQTTAPGGSQQGLITLRQTIRLFPDCFILEGSFQRNAHSKIASIPLADSFHLLTSSQTGHPLPMQHNGWALPKLWLEEVTTPTLSWFFQHQQRISQELRTSGSLAASQVKRLLTLKQNGFKKLRRECLQLHQELAEQIMIAGQGSTSRVIQDYFLWLQSRPDAFEQISQLYQMLNDTFLSEPEQGASWLESQEHHPARDYFDEMGRILARGWQNPKTLFGRQILHAFYCQLASFIEELELELDETQVEDRLLALLKQDIECFRTDPLERVITIPQRAVAEMVSLQ